MSGAELNLCGESIEGNSKQYPVIEKVDMNDMCMGCAINGYVRQTSGKKTRIS